MGTPAHLFRQTITVAELTGRDAYGKPVMGPAATARARIQPLQKLIRDAKGQEAQATHVVYTDAAITLNSRVWFPGEPRETLTALGARSLSASTWTARG